MKIIKSIEEMRKYCQQLKRKRKTIGSVGTEEGYLHDGHMSLVKIAKENQLPIKKDEDLIELLSKLDVDAQIPDNMYKAVAEIFTYIYELNKKNKDL